jgi:aspartyl-tRNA(Asn)/glutamyl-tRNA(Gln) amidotransferase subunit B
MADLEAVIGLEIHVQLATRTKMFCGCELSFGDEPNIHTCPICLAHPGVLPVPNEQAILYALQIAAALECEVAPHSIFHRKNYFYPDSPKAYQISQYDVPICRAGRLGDVRIHRVHLEEDAAKLVHVSASGRIHGSDRSVVDFNRCGTPLVEIVTEPDLRSPEQAIAFLALLKNTLQTIGVSDCDMEKGSLRCDANVSVRRAGSSEFGIKTELKNMNSFKFLGDGMAAEIRRQIDLLERRLQVVQETLHYDPGTKALRSLRSKEEAHDYRYFPEPDLVPLAPSPELIERLRDGLPELPAARIERFASQHGLPPAYATDLNAEPRLANYFEAVAASSDAKSAADWVLNTRPAPVDTVPAATLASLIGLIAGGTITNSIARQVYEMLVADPTAEPAQLVERHGLASIGDSGELEAMVDEVIAENPAFVEQFQSGKDGVINALVGQVMKRTQGRADARQVQELLRSKL